MNARSATALGASLLALALPTAAQASTLGGVTDGLGSTKVEAKVQINGPVEAKAKLEAKVKAKVRAKVNAKAGGTEARQTVDSRNGARLETGVRSQVPPVKADIRLKARAERVTTRGVARTGSQATGAIKRHGLEARHRAERLAHGKLRRGGRLVHRSRRVAVHAKQRVEPYTGGPGRGLGEPLAGIGREVGNPLQAGLAGGLLIALGCGAGTLARAGFRRSLR